MAQLKDGGMGKTIFEDKILAETQLYVDYFITSHKNQPIDMTDSLKLVTMNVVLVALNIPRIDYDNPTLNELTAALGAEMATSNKAAMTKNIPFWRYMPDIVSGKLLRDVDFYISETYPSLFMVAAVILITTFLEEEASQ